VIATQVVDNEDKRIQQLAGEVAIRAILDIRLLQRRGVLDGLKLSRNGTAHDGNKIDYPDKKSVRKLLKDFKNGTVLFWCRAAGANIDQGTLNRTIRKRYDGNPKFLA
jgi:hypothetical protein